jgi:putative ABC transport system ATP-binding protein
MHILQRLNREQGITIVLVTHEHDVAEYARRTLVMRDGLLVEDRVKAA